MGEKLVQLHRHRLDLLGESFLDPGFLARADRRDGLAHAAERPQAVEGLDRGQRDEAEAEEAEGAHHRPAEDTDLLRSEEHTSELQSLMRISYAVFCLKKKKNRTTAN